VYQLTIAQDNVMQGSVKIRKGFGENPSD